MHETRQETPHGIQVGHPEATCERCGGPNIVWHAPSELWNRAIPEDGILCPLCFVVAARAAGIDEIWRLQPADYSADAQLGAALRAALAEVTPEGGLNISLFDYPHGERVWIVNGGSGPRERPEDAALAALLAGAPRTETP